MDVTQSLLDLTSKVNESAGMIAMQRHLAATLRIISMILLITTFWILICVAVYGTKTGRWMKTGRASSLNNGVVYVSLTATIASFVLLHATTLLTDIMPTMIGSDVCEIVGDVKNINLILSISFGYVFLWIRLRIIYNHPQVKPQITKVTDVSSRVVVLGLLLIQVVAISVVAVLPASYELSPYGCRKRTTDGLQYYDFMGIIAELSIQLSLVGFTIYPVFRIDFDSFAEENATVKRSTTRFRRVTEILLPFCQKWYWKSSEKKYHLNPIQNTVRRTVINCIIVIFVDIASMAIDQTVQYHNILMLQYIGYDIAAFIKTFCMLGTFSFSFRVLTFYCPAR